MPTLTNLSASAAVTAAPSLVSGLVISVLKANSEGRVTLHDGGDAGDPVIFDLVISNSTSSQPFTLFFTDQFAPRFSSGLYVAITTAIVNLWYSSR